GPGGFRVAAVAPVLDRLLALRRESLGKEEGCNDCITETFRRNPVGNQSHPVEPGPQPEASLAWGLVTATAKRRQPAFRPCYGAPRDLPAASLRLCQIGGRASAP